MVRAHLRPLTISGFHRHAVLPYTGMVLSFTVMGSLLAEPLHWDRLAAIVVVYFLALGVGGHALDALGKQRR